MSSTLQTPLLDLQPVGPGALARAYDEHADAVYGLAERITGDSAAAAQLTAAVFAGLHTIATSPDHGLLGCLLTDVHRRAVVWRRSNREATDVDFALTLDGLSTLADDERAVLAEAYFGGKTYDEVANTLGISRGEAARLMQQALHHLGSATTASPRLTFGPKTI